MLAVETTTCAASDCSNEITPNTNGGGSPKRHCSRRCTRREAHRRADRARGASVKGSLEHRAKVSAALMGHPVSEETRAKISMKGRSPRPGAQNERHGQWRGDDAAVRTLHQWLNRHYPKAGVCEDCGAEGPTDYAFQRHPEPHTRDRDDYREMCRFCHFAFDAENGSFANNGRRDAA